jgi:phosphoinositide-3-kinase regulatory subunit 4
VADFRIEELIDPPPRLPGVRALLPLSGGAGLLTAGSDCRIRMWDHLRYDQTASQMGVYLFTRLSMLSEKESWF